MAYNNMSGTVFLPAELRPRLDVVQGNILSGNLSTSDAADVINVPRVSNATNNAILTNVNGDANNLICESNLTFDGNTLNVTGDMTASAGASFLGPVNISSSAGLTITGSIFPSGSTVFNLGSATQRWGSLFVGTGSVHLGPDCAISSIPGGIVMNKSTFITGALSASLNISASAFYGDGSNLINVKADNVVAEGPTNSLQFHDPADGDLTGSSNLKYANSALFLTGALYLTGTLDLDGDLVPATANARDLGTAAKPWRSLYISEDTIYFGNDSLSVESGNMKFGSGSATKAFNVGHMHLKDRGIVMDQGRVFNLAAHQMKFNGGIAVKRNTISENHVMTNGEYLIAVQTDQLTGSTVAVTLPPGTTVVNGQTFIIKDEGGAASTKPITILTQADNLIDGKNSVVLESPYAAITLYCNGLDKYFIC